MKVICNQCHGCKEEYTCGAAVLHEDTSCGPCPFNPDAKCVPILPAIDNCNTLGYNKGVVKHQRRMQ
jgi:hypothetical protein